MHRPKQTASQNGAYGPYGCTMEPRLRGHPRDKEKCPLKIIVVLIFPGQRFVSP